MIERRENEDVDRLIQTIRTHIIGQDRVIQTPFGERRITYADYTASGRSLKFIEEFILKQVLPLYANTHTEASGTGQQTTLLREEARDIIGEAVGATEEDVVICFGVLGVLFDCVTIDYFDGFVDAGWCCIACIETCG